MALQSFGTNVTMSASDINVELGNDSTAQLDFQTAGQSFAGIRNVETTEGYGALAVEFREFFGKTFSAGSGTYGTRNSHVLRFLSDDGSLRAYGGGELVFAAEAVVSPVSINGTVSTFNVSKFVDDFVDDDLTVGDDIYNASSGTAVFDNSSHIVNTIAGDSSKYYCDDTSDKVFRLQSSGNVAVVFDRKPATPTISLASKTNNSITINIVGDTRVARTIRTYQDSTETTLTSGSDFTAGNSGNTNISQQHTYSSLSANTEYTLKARYENAFDNGDDSNTLTITTLAGATAWSNQFGDFTMDLANESSAPFTSQTLESSEVTIDLANGTGDTTISCEQPSNGVAALKVKVGTSSGNYDLQGTYATSATVTAASRYFLKFELTEGTADGEFGQEDMTITFTNNSVSPSTAPEITVLVSPGK
tara:strand:+ start:740 stop:1999 length:1260 start_codon:yes stop_codon:yes gene_type:complete